MEDVNFYFSMDHYYLGTDARRGNEDDADPKWVPGGLTNVIKTLGHIEKEIKIGTLARSKNAMPSDLLTRLTTREGKFAECRWVYLSAIGSADQARLDVILRPLFSRLDREKEFWLEFRRRVVSSLSDQFRVAVSVFVPIGTANWMPSYLQERVNQMLDGWPAPTASAAVSERVNRVMTHFPPLKDLQWSEVSMEFVSNEAIRVAARGISRQYTFVELGFKDGRRNAPDTQWEFLKLMAKNLGLKQAKVLGLDASAIPEHPCASPPTH